MDDERRAEFLSLLIFASASLKPLVSNQIFLAKFYLNTQAETEAKTIFKDKPEDSEDSEKYDAYVKQYIKNHPDTLRIKKSMETFNTKLAPFLVTALGDYKYFLGNQEEPTAVDFMMTKPLGNAHALKMLEEFPTLKEHYLRMSNRPSHKIAYTSVPEGVYAFNELMNHPSCWNDARSWECRNDARCGKWVYGDNSGPQADTDGTYPGRPDKTEFKRWNISRSYMTYEQFAQKYPKHT